MIKKFLVPLLCYLPAIWADWNEEYLQNSYLLFETFECFDNHYLSNINKLLELKTAVESKGYAKKLSKLTLEDKRNYFEARYVLKKRAEAHCYEALFWEISWLLSFDEYVTPSYPIMFGNNMIILQPLEQLVVANRSMNIPHRKAKNVSLLDYFFAHIYCYIMGAQDLSGKNIGITTCPEKIRLFDNEDVFKFQPIPHKTELSFFIPFVSVAFDWEQYRQPINATISKKIQQRIAQLSGMKGDLHRYGEIRAVPREHILGICNRIDTLSRFEFREGTSFMDFIYYLYPKLASGLDSLNLIVSEILNREVDHGVALFYATKVIRYRKPSAQEKTKLDDWIANYL